MLDDQHWQTIRAVRPRPRQAAVDIREIMLANLVMIGEIPAPTFQESERIRHVLQRFMECGLQSCSTDDKSNGLGFLPGSDGARNILLVTNVDTFVADREDQTIEVFPDRLVGPFVGDNSLALAAMITLPTLLEKLDIRLKANVYFLAAAQMLERGNLDGLRYFLCNTPPPLHYGLCVESVQLGRLNHFCLGMLRGEITCRLPEDYRWSEFGASGTILPMTDIIQRLSRIPVPRRPLTNLVMGSIQGGLTYQNIARTTLLKFELRSESADILNQIREQIEDVCEDVAAHMGVKVDLDFFARREPGGLDVAHPLVKTAKAVLAALNVPSMVYATTSALSALNDHKVPAVTVGITSGERRHDLDEIDEFVSIDPMFTGLAQLVGLLLSMDGGLCDESAGMA
ncbi:MAG: peptidase [Lentisphaerota bacterium]